MIQSSELILNPDGSIFHLHLKPEQVAQTILLVGDQGRVDVIASFFDEILHEVQNREFKTVTGKYNKKLISVISTGIGTDNIDIVVNELDALFNIDLVTKELKKENTKLNLIRIGTSGSLQEDIPVNSWVASQKSIGFDGLLNFYEGRNQISDLEFEKAFVNEVDWHQSLPSPYVINCSEELLNKINGPKVFLGVNISAPGFYGPQGRVLRLNTVDNKLNDKIEKFKYHSFRITNYEMESSAIYGLSALLGHEALTICLIIANRIKKEANEKYHGEMKKLILYVLDAL